MLDSKVWTCPPQVKDLPRDAQIGVTCRSCGRRWDESMRSLVETHRLGAEYVDLLEWKYRCQDEACGGFVRFTYPDEIVTAASAPAQAATPVRPRLAGTLPERLPYPSKAVVKPRFYAEPLIPPHRRQLPLPLGMA